MSYSTIKFLFHHSIDIVCSDLSSFIVCPGKDLTQNRKIPPQQFNDIDVSLPKSSSSLYFLQAVFLLVKN